ETTIVSTSITMTTTVTTAIPVATAPAKPTGILKLAEDNNYNEEEANQLEEKAEKLVDCVENFELSLVKLGVQKNDSCISCDQINTLSNFNTNSTASKNESVAILKLLYSLGEAMVDDDDDKCKFSLKCMSTNGTCAQNSQNSQSSG
ncbi:22940_t:CDS:1, partial [Dentiscutata erythropus]